MFGKAGGLISKLNNKIKQHQPNEFLKDEYEEKQRKENDILKNQRKELQEKLQTAENNSFVFQEKVSKQCAIQNHSFSSDIKEENERLWQEKMDLEDVLEEYIKLFRDIFKCTSLQELSKICIEGGDWQNLTMKDKVHIVNFVGADFHLARQIYFFMEKYKKQNNTFITEEERVMIKSVNKYYRSRKNNPCEFDVLDLLGVETNTKCEFKRKSMKDLTEVGKSDFAYVEGIYVPALKTESDNGFEKKAIVKGD